MQNQMQNQQWGTVEYTEYDDAAQSVAITGITVADGWVLIGGEDAMQRWGDALSSDEVERILHDTPSGVVRWVCERTDSVVLFCRAESLDRVREAARA